MKRHSCIVLMILAPLAGIPSFAQGSFALKAGAAKVDVTPAESELPKNYEGIWDHIYSRAIVIGDGETKAALLTLDAGGTPEQLWQNVTKRAEAELRIPAKNILMTATHSHSVPRITSSCLVTPETRLRRRRDCERNPRLDRPRGGKASVDKNRFPIECSHLWWSFLLCAALDRGQIAKYPLADHEGPWRGYSGVMRLL
jgi:hypothetical protein